jgi:1-acyl-sn-glycerol-3-phosphate acyltransferase
VAGCGSASQHSVPLARGVLIVANHVSWLDSALISLATTGRVVAAAEAAGWPRILIRSRDRVGMITVDRDSPRALPALVAATTAALRNHDNVIAFPEATTYCGRHAGEFHGAIFESALQSGASVQPVRIRYRSRDGHLSTAPAFLGDETIASSLQRIAGAHRTIAELWFLDPEPAGVMDSRRDLARRARSAIFEEPDATIQTHRAHGGAS